MIDTEHENAKAVENWFKRNNKEICCDDLTVFQIYKDISYRGTILNSESIKDRIRVAKIQMSYIRKNILGLMHKYNDKSSKGIKQGYVYAIHNPAWNDFVKIGVAVDVYDRLKSYQTSSPLRDYELIGYVFSNDRLALEKEIHQKFEKNNEWVKTSKETIKKFLKQHEDFPLEIIENFAVQETIKAIGKSSQLLSTPHDSEKIRRFFTLVNSSLAARDSRFHNINLLNKNLLKRENHTWTSLVLNLKVKVENGAVIMLE